MFRCAGVILLTLSLAGLPAHAAGANSEEVTLISPGESVPALPVRGNVDWLLRPGWVGPSLSERPAVLPALYVSFAALQAFDGFSTMQGIARGAQEANPLMHGAVGSPVALWALKVTTAAVPMVLTERLWRTHRMGAIVVMALANGLTAAVALNNVRVLHQSR